MVKSLLDEKETVGPEQEQLEVLCGEAAVLILLQHLETTAKKSIQKSIELPSGLYSQNY